MPECAIVCSILLCVNTKDTMGGIISNTPAAAEAPDRAIPPALIWLNAVGRSFSSSLKITPPEPAFQMLVKESTITVIHAGFTLGITILKKIFISLAPSILAASSRESGICSIN